MTRGGIAEVRAARLDAEDARLEQLRRAGLALARGGDAHEDGPHGRRRRDAVPGVADLAGQRLGDLGAVAREVLRGVGAAVGAQRRDQRPRDVAGVEVVGVGRHPAQRPGERGLDQRVPLDQERAVAREDVPEPRVREDRVGARHQRAVETRADRRALLRRRGGVLERARERQGGAESRDRLPSGEHPRNRDRPGPGARDLGPGRGDVGDRGGRGAGRDDGDGGAVRAADEGDEVTADGALVRVHHGEHRGRGERRVERVAARSDRGASRLDGGVVRSGERDGHVRSPGGPSR
ncbi:hypothetical protein RKD05_000760 [Microbacterium sp. SLBN-111]